MCGGGRKGWENRRQLAREGELGESLLGMICQSLDTSWHLGVLPHSERGVSLWLLSEETDWVRILSSGQGAEARAHTPPPLWAVICGLEGEGGRNGHSAPGLGLPLVGLEVQSSNLRPTCLTLIYSS